MSAKASHLRSSARERPSLTVVRRKRRSLINRQSSRRVAPIFIVGAILIAALVFAVLLEQIVLAQSAFKLDAMNKRVTAATSVHEGLLYQTAKLSSPGRIERYARTKLGMIDPPAINYIVANVSPRRASNRRGLASAPGAATAGQAAPIVPPDGTP